MIEKYTQPRAYLPDFVHGSCFCAAARPGGLGAVTGIFMRFASDRVVVVSRSRKGIRIEGMAIVGRPSRRQWQLYKQFCSYDATMRRFLAVNVLLRHGSNISIVPRLI